MSKYRIVKMKGYEHAHKVQLKCLFFWVDTYFKFASIEKCEWFIESELRDLMTRKNNPKNIVIKTYEVK